MKRREYKQIVIQCDVDKMDERYYTQERLDQLIDEGWELVSVFSIGNENITYAKLEREEKNAAS